MFNISLHLYISTSGTTFYLFAPYAVPQINLFFRKYVLNRKYVSKISYVLSNCTYLHSYTHTLNDLFTYQICSLIVSSLRPQPSVHFRRSII